VGVTSELSALAAISFASSTSGTGAGKDIVGVRASAVPVATLCTGVTGRDPESVGFVNRDPLAAARLGMGGGTPVPGAGEVVRDGGPMCEGVPGRESGSAILSGSVEECRLWPDARGGRRGGAAWLVIDVVAGGAGEEIGEGADGGRASGSDVITCTFSPSFECRGAISSFRCELVAAVGLELPNVGDEVELCGARSTLRLGMAGGGITEAGSTLFGLEDGSGRWLEAGSDNTGDDAADAGSGNTGDDTVEAGAVAE
jgi:hypothetical protein